MDVPPPPPKGRFVYQYTIRMWCVCGVSGRSLRRGGADADAPGPADGRRRHKRRRGHRRWRWTARGCGTCGAAARWKRAGVLNETCRERIELYSRSSGGGRRSVRIEDKISKDRCRPAPRRHNKNEFLFLTNVRSFASVFKSHIGNKPLEP